MLSVLVEGRLRTIQITQTDLVHKARKVAVSTYVARKLKLLQMALLRTTVEIIANE